MPALPDLRRGLRCVLTLACLFLLPPGARALGPPDQVMRFAGSRIDISLPDEPLSLSSSDLLNWVHTAAGAVSHYYGRFPVPHLTLRIQTGRGAGIRHGVTYPRDGGLIVITVGQSTGVADLKDDWTLTHEMLHLGFPSLADNHHWLEEGISTYVEPVARAQVGNMTAQEVWREFLRDMPKGEPGDGDRGLDNTRTWGRTYWGGALFCLVADVQIRERTHNRRSLRDALRAIRKHGGVIDEDWDIEKALALGDRATGTTVLQTLYGQMKADPAPVDLPQLWQKLGVDLRGGEVVFDNTAPEASIRQAITSPD